MNATKVHLFARLDKRHGATFRLGDVLSFFVALGGLVPVRGFRVFSAKTEGRTEY